MRLKHGRIEMQLHDLGGGARTSDPALREAIPLLLLHALGGSVDDWSTDVMMAWPGPVHGLDFAGHGASEHVTGGGYFPEYFMVEADAAVDALGGTVAIAGAGVGAYVALLLAGARPEAVRSALLLPGIGLAGGGGEPNFDERPFASLEEWERRTREEAARYRVGTDPMVSACEHDLRPPSYAAEFAAAARALLFSASVDAEPGEIPWWDEARSRSKGRVAPASAANAITALFEATRP